MGYIIDLSKWNENINWDLAAHHIDLAICRVQYGSRKVDELYKDHVANLEVRGIPHAAYSYGCYVSIDDAIVEAKDFMARTSPNARFLVLDVEEDTLKNCGAVNLAKASQTFINTCKEGGWKVGLYVSHQMYGAYGLQNVNADFVWLPRYGKQPAYLCDLWQYADNATGGYVEGIGSCDVNCIMNNKTLEWFIGGEDTADRIEGIGVATFTTTDGVNGYDSPYDGNYVRTFHGDRYIAYGYVNGMYGLGGNVWVPANFIDFKPHVATLITNDGVNAYDAPNGPYKRTFHGGSYVIYARKDSYVDVGQSTWISEQYVRITKG